MTITNNILVGKSEGNTALRRTRCRWENNFNVDFKETMSDNVGWTHLFQDRVLWWALMKIVTKFP
jgi:hypothetical protein